METEQGTTATKPTATTNHQPEERDEEDHRAKHKKQPPKRAGQRGDSGEIEVQQEDRGKRKAILFFFILNS